jgi:hypothetical protein
MLTLIEGQSSKVIVDQQNTEGLMEFSINHEIKETKAFINYVGPKIPKEEWAKILSFFKWTYETWKSESQARLFVNVKEGTWRAWVFPQESGTGMSAREIDGDEHRKQHHELFGDNLDWVLFGTVHHHCGCSAFQSGTDRSNEENQDGLHITMGKMDEKVHDIHARFYRKKWQLEKALDMSNFWDVSGHVASIPEFCKRFIPHDFGDKVAREQMCQPSAVEFPEQWKSNVITNPKPESTTTVYPKVYGNNGHSYHPTASHGWSGSYDPEWKRAQSAWSDITDECATNKISRDTISKAMNKLLNENSPLGIISGALHRHRIGIKELCDEILKMPVNRPSAPSTVGGGIPVDKEIVDMEDEMERQWREFSGM